MKKLFSISAFLFVISVSAQIQTRTDSFNELRFLVSTNNPKYEGAEGSKYLNDDFVPARIEGFADTKFIRFNVVENVVEVKKGDKVMAMSLAENYSIKLLDGSKKEYFTSSYIDGEGNNGVSFFEKVYESEKFNLYKKEVILFRDSKPEKSSFEKAEPARFIEGKDVFYMLDPKSQKRQLEEIPRKKKNISVFFGERWQSVKTFIKKEKLKLDSKDDLVEILNFFVKDSSQ